MKGVQAPKKSGLRALLGQAKKGWKKAFGGRQRSRSPLRPLRHEDRHPPTKRGPMYSTMPSAGGSSERSALDNQRWDPALEGAAGGSLQRGPPERRGPEVTTGGKGAMTARGRLEGY